MPFQSDVAVLNSWQPIAGCTGLIFPKQWRLYFAILIQKDFSLNEDLGPIFITADGTQYNGGLSLLRRGRIGLEVPLELCVVGGLEGPGCWSSLHVRV